MKAQQQVQAYIDSLGGSKKTDMQALHQLILESVPGIKTRFLDGKNEEGKVVSNPNIGYGSYQMQYADGSSKEFYQVGISANTSGISLYILGIDDKKYLADTYGKTIGKATLTGYCIKFKALKDINLDTLKAAILYGIANSSKINK